MAGWTYDETKALISAWGEENVQEQLDNVKRNKDIYMRISASLAEHGYVKSWKQCRVKVKNLTQRYRKIKDNNNVSGKGRKSFDFYDDIDEILGTRAASSPSILLESGANAEEVEERQDIQIPESWSNSHDQSNDDMPLDHTSTEISQEEPLSDEDETHNAGSDTNSSATAHPTSSSSESTESTTGSNSKTTNRQVLKKGVKRRLKRNAQQSEIMEMLIELETKSEERFHEGEEKRLKMFLDAEERRQKDQAEEERMYRREQQRHEERMQAMFMSFMQNTVAVFAGHGQYVQPNAGPYSTHPITPSPPYHQSPMSFPQSHQATADNDTFSGPYNPPT